MVGNWPKDVYVRKFSWNVNELVHNVTLAQLFVNYVSLAVLKWNSLLNVMSLF